MIRIAPTLLQCFCYSECYHLVSHWNKKSFITKKLRHETVITDLKSSNDVLCFKVDPSDYDFIKVYKHKRAASRSKNNAI